MTKNWLFIKRWSVAESFTIFENHVYRSKKNLMFAINFEATPFLVGSFFLMVHKQKFAINFEATPFLVGSFFSDATQQRFAINFEATPFLVGSFFF